MIVENAFTVAAPMDAVFDALRDVRTVLPCIDARVTEIVDDHTARGEVTIPDGDATMVLSGTLRIGEADREAGAITFVATAQGAQGRMRVRLRESAGSTTVSVEADTDPPLHAQGGAALQLFARLGDEVTDRLARRVEPPVRGTVRLVAPPVPTPAHRPRGVAGAIRRRPATLLPVVLLGAAAVIALRRRDQR